MILSDEQLKAIVPLSLEVDRRLFGLYFNKHQNSKFGIPDNEVAAFIAQVAHESFYFHYLTEIGRRSYFDKYEHRKDLGNTYAGDGYTYRGRGYIQLTGRANYTAFRDWLGGKPDVVLHPELVAQPNLGVLAALYFWQTKKCGEVSNDIVKLTKRINGGLNGLDNRTSLYKRAREVLHED